MHFFFNNEKSMNDKITNSSFPRFSRIKKELINSEQPELLNEYNSTTEHKISDDDFKCAIEVAVMLLELEERRTLPLS